MSRTALEEIWANSWAVGMMMVSMSGASRRFASAMERSVSKSIMFRTPRTMWWMPSSRQVSMVRLSYWMTETPVRPSVAFRMMSTRLSISKKPRLSWLMPTATTTSSNIVRARLRIFRWPAVNGSKEPGNRALIFITANQSGSCLRKEGSGWSGRSGGSRRRHRPPAVKDVPP